MSSSSLFITYTGLSGSFELNIELFIAFCGCGVGGLITGTAHRGRFPCYRDAGEHHWSLASACTQALLTWVIWSDMPEQTFWKSSRGSYSRCAIAPSITLSSIVAPQPGQSKHFPGALWPLKHRWHIPQPHGDTTSSKLDGPSYFWQTGQV